MNRKALEERRNDLKSQMSNLIENSKKENRALTENEVAEFDNCEREIKDIDATILREEKVNNMEEKEVKVDERSLTNEEKEVKEFLGYVRSVVENRANVNLTSGDNGVIIPTSIAKKVIATAYDMSSILKDATKYNTKGNLSVPRYGANNGTDVTMAYSNEFTELESKIGKFDSIELGNHLAGALALLSKSLISNSDIDLENKIIEVMALAIARFQEKECLYGTDGKVQGLREVTLSVNATSATAITADELIKLKNKVKKQYRKNAKWIMSNDTLTAIELLKDGNDRFIFREDVNGEFDGYLLGYPVEVSDNMEEMATKKTPIYFGDFSGLALKQRADALELNVLREKFATQHAVGINAWLEFDAKVENVQKIAKLVMA